ncbi:Extracellular endo-alpha-(1-_5)-L-arabinanase 1 precursor [compost metagenome]
MVIVRSIKNSSVICILFALCVCSLSCGGSVSLTPDIEGVKPISYEIIEDKLPIADPYVLYHNGKYYAYGTRINGFEVYISEDLKHWKRSNHLALSPEHSWGTRWYWAPEVYYVASKNRFYMFYTVDEHICVASANTPTGPFLQEEKKPIVANEKGIDPSLFIDKDGTPYLYFVRFTSGNVIWVAEMNDDLQSIKTNTLTKCISADENWEKIQGTVAEGPSVLKKGETYYLMYSANHFESKDYGVGYATASFPKGPWKKYNENPILRRDKPAASGLVGTGHGAPFVCADGTYKYIYHAHADINNVGPRRSYINDLGFSAQGVISISGEPIRPVIIK